MSKVFNSILAMTSLLAVLLAAGCATEREPVRAYDRAQVGVVQQTEQGTIVSLTPVDIEDSDSRAGTVIGAVAGGLAGRQLGGGTGRDIMTVIGAVAGGYAGSEVGDDDAARASGVEIGLEMDDGREITIVQELDENEMFRVGDRVSVHFNGDNTAEVRSRRS